MTTYYLCDLKNKTVLYSGDLPPSWGNLCSISQDDPNLKDMTCYGHPGLGFLTESEALELGIPRRYVKEIQHINKTRLWSQIREERNHRIWDIKWRVERHNDEKALGRKPTEDITDVLNYIQALRDLTLQNDPENVVWPKPPPIIRI